MAGPIISALEMVPIPGRSLNGIHSSKTTNDTITDQLLMVSPR